MSRVGPGFSRAAVVSGFSRTLWIAGLTLTTACSGHRYTQVSHTTAGAYEASLTPVGDGFVAAWYDTRDGHGEIYMRRLDGDGKGIAPERRLTTVRDGDAYEADISPSKDSVVIGWYEKTKDGQLTPKYGAFALDGTARWVKTLSARGRNTVVRASGGLVFAAWIEDEDKEHAGVWVTWRRADGGDLIAPRRVADAGRTTWNLNAAIDPAATPGQPRAWVTFDAKAGTRAEELFLVETAETTDRVVRLTPDDGVASKYPDVAFAGGDPSTPLGASRAALTWFDMKDGNEEVYLSVGSAAALARGEMQPARITSTPGHSIGAYVAWNGDRVGLAWCDDSPGNQEVYFQSFDAGGRPESEATRVTETDALSSVPAIKPWRNGFALLWNEHTPDRAEGHSGGKSQVAFRFVR